jgi:hypothetical protein
MSSWKQVTEYDGSSVQINMNNITHIKRGTADEVTTIFFVNEMYITVKETPDQLLLAQPLRSF